MNATQCCIITASKPQTEAQKSQKKHSLADSQCTKSVFAKNKLDKYGFKYDPNIDNERLIAAGDKMRVCGVLQSLYTYSGKTNIMRGLVTPKVFRETSELQLSILILEIK